MARNPAWVRDELILALDLYFRVGRKHEPPTHPDVIGVSVVLNRLPIHDTKETEKFRNPAGVSMKLGNFLAHDPDYPGSGLSRGNRLEREVWDEFASNPGELRRLAEAIASGAEEVSTTPPVDEDEEFSEGRVLARLHKVRERNPKAVAQKKRRVLAETGRLACEACGFDFESK